MSGDRTGEVGGLLRRLVRPFLPTGVAGEAILGDLDEEHAKLADLRGEAHARSWMRRQLLGLLISYAIPRAMGLVPRVHRGIETEAGSFMATLHGISEDVRHALRRFGRQPIPTSLAVVTLAFAIGANTAIFSVVDAVLWKPLPYPESHRLVQVVEENPELAASRGLDYSLFHVNALDYLAYAEGANTFEALGFVFPFRDEGYVSVGGGGLPAERVGALGVSPTFFDVMGMPPVLGRSFLPEETAPPGEYLYVPVAVITHELWTRRFRSDPEILGRDVQIEAGPVTVVGVLPPGFTPPPILVRGQVDLRQADVYFPLHYEAFYQPRRYRQFGVVARLREGVAPEDAEADLRRIAAGLAEAEPEARAGFSPVVLPLQNHAERVMGTSLMALFGAVLFVLLVACANVANLLLAMGSARKGELAVRSALGGGRRRIVRQLVTESMLMAAMGGVLGVAVAWAASGLLLDLVPEGIPRAQEAGVDLRVLAFAMALSFVTSFAFGVVPALRSSRVDLTTMLKTGGGTVGSGPRGVGFSHGLIVSQVALTLVLLIGASLLARSFLRLEAAPTGFDPDNVLVAEVHRGIQWRFAGVPRSDEARLKELWQKMYDLRDAIAALPGVESVAIAGALPLGESRNVWPFQFEPAPEGQQPERTLNSELTFASPDYFEAMGIPIVRGSGLPAWDRVNDWERYWWSTDCTPGLEAYCVAVVSETFAETAWPGEDPIGKELGIYGCCWRVVGVAADIMHRGVDAPALVAQFDPRMHVYSPAAQIYNLVIRTTPEPRQLMAQVREAVASADPDLALTFTTMEDRVADSLARPRFYLVVVGIFGVAALVLSFLGLYGVVGYAVGRRTREIGMRMALGARRDDVHRMVVGQAMRPVVAGIVLGIIGALGLRRVMESLLYGMSPVDPLLFTVLPLALLAVAAVSSYVPARKASMVDPVRTLSAE